MSFQIVLLIGLIMMTQVQSVTIRNLCLPCGDYLNAVQCNATLSKVATAPGFCMFVNDVCIDPPTNTNAVADTVTEEFALCATKGPTNCYGFNGLNNPTKKCGITADGVCVVVDNTVSCLTFTNQTFCSKSPFCNWAWNNTDTTNNSDGVCALKSCAIKLSKSDCFFVFSNTQFSTAIACRWTPDETAIATSTIAQNETAGSCGPGIPTDITKEMCSSGQDYFTFSSALNECTRCKGTYRITPDSDISRSNILPSVVFALFVALLSL